MVFGLLREGKVPPDKRVVLSPNQCKSLVENTLNIAICVQESEVRAFKNEEYLKNGLKVMSDVSKCDVLLGVKEVPIAELIPNKTYLFFSHTIKEQPYNRKLLQAILEKNIRLIDWETIRDANGNRLIGFGVYAGIVGAYNGFRAWGSKHKSFDLKPAHLCYDKKEMYSELKKLNLPAIKIVLTGEGRVAQGAVETLDAAGIKRVDEIDFLSKKFNEPVYTQISIESYYTSKNGQTFKRADFYKNPQDYQSTFMRFAKHANMYIAGHFYGEGAPFLFTREDAKKEDFNIKLVADISCDIDGPVASTIRPSTIDSPFYGYDRYNEIECDFLHPDAIAVMAVDNLPCELPIDASVSFGEQFINNVLPHFLNNDKNAILKNACIAENGKLSARFEYLQKYVDVK